MEIADNNPYVTARRLVAERGDAALDYAGNRTMEWAKAEDVKEGAKWLAVQHAVMELQEASAP